jgi:hypothetical protein
MLRLSVRHWKSITGSHWISDDYHFKNKPTVTQGQAKEVDALSDIVVVSVR